MLEGFKGLKRQQIGQKIEEDRKRRVNDTMKLKGVENEEDAEDYANYAKNMDEKRKFMNDLRPGRIWNFFQDPEDEKVDHVMRHDANPDACYIDGRVKEILNNIDEMAMNLANHEPVVWEMILKNTHAVFKSMYDKHHDALAAV